MKDEQEENTQDVVIATSNAIQRAKEVLPKVSLEDVADEQGAQTVELAVGNLYLDNKGNLTRITKLVQVYRDDKKFGYHHTQDARIFTDEKGAEYILVVSSETRHYTNYRYAKGEGHDIEWSLEDKKNSTRFLQEYLQTRLLKSLAEYESEALTLIETGDFSAYSVLDKNGSIKSASREDASNTETGLVHSSSKEHMQAIAQDVQLQRNHIQLVTLTLSREMERRRSEVEAVSQKLKAALVVFGKQLKRIYRFIETIELYLGIKEEIIQIQEGEKAPQETPVSFRQQVLYMDEEVGALGTDGKGLDYKNIETFDTWLLEDKNYLRVLPEDKGVVVFRVRRIPKDYGGNPIVSAMKNKENMMTYVLIRNGENIYRIWADLIIEPRLFPLRKEFAALREKLDKIEWERDKEKAQDEFDETMQTYKARAIMMQGLIDRTDILHPFPGPINLFRLEGESQNYVNFIYDDEIALPTGRKTFWEWHDEINSKIERGSRIILSGYWQYSKKDYEDRWIRDYNEHNLPERPKRGLYTVETIPGQMIEYGLAEKYRGPISDKTISYEEEVMNNRWSGSNFKKDENGKYIMTRTEPRLFIRYNPGGKTYGGWGDNQGTERKNNISFEIRKDEDEFVLNYDYISLEDIDFYLNSRTDRPNYLEILPLLRELKRHRLDEIKWETDFVALVVNEVRKEHGHIIGAGFDVDAVVWEAVNWWKTKVIWKRPITKDDAKALRMIKGRVEKAFV